NLNFTAGQTIPNLVVARLGTNGSVTLYNGSGGTVKLMGNVAGYYLSGTPTAPGTFQSLSPSCLLDTRTGTGAPKGAVGAGKSVALKVTGKGGVPASGVGAVVLNVTATAPTGPGFITVYPAGATLPAASNLNFTAGQTIPNLVVARLGTNGSVTLFNGSG